MKKFSLIILPLLCSSISLAQTKKAVPTKKPTVATPKKTPVTVPSVIYSQEPFYLDDGALMPPDYNGHDIVALYRTLKKSGLKKDEFETTAQYQERVKNVGSAPIFGALKRDSLFAISIPAFGDYDADKGIFDIRFSIEDATSVGSFSIGEPDEGILVFSQIGPKQSTYDATNGFGAKAMVSKTEFEDYGVFLNGWSKIALTKPEFNPSLAPDGYLALPMPAAKAKALKWSMRVVVSFRLKPDYFSDGIDRTEKATFEKPSETWHSYHVARGTVEDVIVFNYKTGEVVYRSSQHQVAPKNNTDGDEGFFIPPDLTNLPPI